jgi:endonuclease/exonuclease/phosphatase family metal-dependent hydrolase
MNQQKSQVLFRRISKAFKQQQQQAEIFKEHKIKCIYPMIICGDMNNSAYSYVYRSIKGRKIALKRLVKDLEKPISSDIIQLELITFC